MAASVAIQSFHGASPSGAAVTAMRFKLADDDVANTNNRVPIPAAGTQYTWLKQLALVASTSPTALIDTLQMYSSGSLPTGVQMFAEDIAYINPVTQAATAVGGWTNNYTGYTSGAPLSLAGSLANPNTGKINTNYLLLQMGITSSAAVGIMSAQTITCSYLES